MSSLKDSQPVNTLLLFADISGYTRYIKDNAFTAVHALQSVRSLLDAVLAALEPAFTLAKLEGDAAFVHASDTMFTDGESLPRTLLAALAAFDAEKAQQTAVNICSCQACMTLDQLELKFILHAGPVLHYQVRNSVELGGLPVIVLHRLSKNSVPARRYILWTQGLSSRMQSLQPVSHYAEHYDEIGRTEVAAHLLQQPDITPVQATLLGKFKDFWRKEPPWWWLTLTGTKGKRAALANAEEEHRH